MARTFASLWRILLVVAAVIGGFGAVLVRLYFLHVEGSAELRAFAVESRELTVAESARRGDIRDVRGNLLATTRPRVDIGVDPQVFRREAAGQLWQVALELGLKPRETVDRVLAAQGATGNGSRWIKLAETDTETHAAIMQRKIPGVYGNIQYERYYPAGSYAAHVIGFVNAEGPTMGVERFLDFYLSGQSGWRETEADSRRREMAQFRVREVEARRGYDVELTIDMVVQSYVEDALAEIVEKYRPAGASIIVSDPMTGDILALGNYPSFDLNRYGESPLGALRNRAVSDLLEPGSTFKIVPVAAALEEDLLNPFSIIDCGQAVVEYRGRQLRLPSDSSSLGAIPLMDVVAKSSNRGVAQIGLLLGENRLYEYSRRFGFGERTDWGMVGEVAGILHPVDAWDGLTITRLPAGYAVSATPMQVHLAMSSIANGGHLMQPRVVRRVMDEKGRTVVDFSVREKERVVSEASARTVAGMLTRVVSNEGTARRAIIPGFAVAGKTGTARKIIDGRYSTQEHFASFSGFFPAQAPKIAITVVVDDANLNGVAYGGVVAAPVFREIGEKLIEYYAMSPSPERPTGVLAWLGREVAP